MKKEPFNFNQVDDGLDDLFRRAAESEQPAMPPHAWLKMNQLLEAEDQKRRGGFAWWWFPLLLFMAGHQHFVPEMGTISKQAAKVQKGNLGQLVQGGEAGIDNVRIDTNTGTVVRKEETREKKETKETKETKVAKVAIATQRIPEGGGLMKQEPFVAEKDNLSIRRAKNNKDGFGVAEENNLYPSLPKRMRLLMPVSVQVDEHEKAEQAVPAASKKANAAKGQYRFYVYCSSGWDRGFINKNHASDYKTAFGGGIGWQLSERWAIQAGINKTRKIYEAPGDAYTPKKGSYYDNPNYVIKEVYADCAILEIPLSVRYNVFKPGRHQLVGMLSIQNAVMERESYNYYYYRFGEPAKSYYTYRTKAVELFSGIGMSIGYEFRLSNRFHIQAMPYLSLPMKGIGEGSVKLRSAGIAAGLRYSFWKKN